MESKIATLENDLKIKMSALDVSRIKVEKLEQELKGANEIIRSFKVNVLLNSNS